MQLGWFPLTSSFVETKDAYRHDNEHIIETGIEHHTSIVILL